METGKQLRVRETPIPGFLVIDLPVHGDNRGWFKENWQREKALALGLPDFGPVQNNISFNAQPGVTRGIHAEPWDKYISVASGRVFGAWVDLREGDSFGATFTIEIDPSVAVFVPRGVGNAFQALEPNTAYSYLVNAHWSHDAQGEYTFLNLADETAGIDWPIPLEQAELSEKDKAHPRLADVTPMPPRKTLVLGANGQLGRALQQQWAGRADVEFVGRDRVDLADPAALEQIRWSSYDTIVNAAGYTAVDAAETDQGRRDAWAVNAMGPARLASIAAEHALTLVHVSSDYVYADQEDERDEQDPLGPLGVYAQTKAAGDLAVTAAPKHYIVRTSWVVGDGKNFVATMASLARRGATPQVVDDQIGRLTFAPELARAIDHLLATGAPHGTYNVSSGGHAASWAQIAKRVFSLMGADAEGVKPVTTDDYDASRSGVAPRPRHSAMRLAKLEATGFAPRDQFELLEEFVAMLPAA
ncbi:sugar nucleotide-binding protein [Agrococcus sp. KRD186]|jgi:dTDP-4-dehydrorhamnose 3,5-epimerase|uniref:sugar nucleotide-binding protein n=1 Tax=Agrococcus sp. KRD186 TaxID=2729730 RepID=UPI0019CF8086|nr:bifunctional dTDP-4-dehydrorhamnose 3,5-epimerase family protein/NAD(P)-dependent oxidoreductase [Agrococcus sp. KRD186]